MDPLPSNGHAAPRGASEQSSRRAPLVPPHVAWPLFIVLLLAMSVGAALFTFYMASSDGGVELVDDAPFTR